MKNLERARNKLYRAIASKCSPDVILSFSRDLDDLILVKMRLQNAKYIKGGQLQ